MHDGHLNLIHFNKDKGQSILHFVRVREGQRTVRVMRFQNSIPILYARPWILVLCTHRSHMRIKLSCSN